MKYRSLIRGTLTVLIALSSQNAHTSAKEDRAAWVGNALHHINKGYNWEYLSFFHEVAAINRSAPETLTGNWLANLALAEKRRIEGAPRNGAGSITSNAPAVDRANEIYTALQQEGMIGYLLGNFFKNEISRNPLNLKAYLQSSEVETNKYREYSGQALEDLQTVYDIAKRNPSVRSAVDQAFSRLFSASIDDNATQILGRNIDLQNNTYLTDLVNGQTLTSQQLEALRKRIMEDAVSATNQLDDVRKQIGQQLESQKQLLNEHNFKVEKFLERMQVEAEEERKAHSDKLRDDALRVGAFVVSALMTDKVAARQFSATINGIADIRAAYRDYERNLQILEASQSSTKMSSTLFTLSLLSAFINISNAFASTGPSADQIILDALRKISEQIENLQKEMHERFDQIDNNLIVVYQEMLSGFQNLDHLVRRVDMGVQAARTAIEANHWRLEIAQSRLLIPLNFLIEQPFKTKMISCLGHEATHGQRLTTEKYADCVDEIRAYIAAGKDEAISGRWAANLLNPATFAKTVEGQSEQSLINLYLGMAHSIGNYPGFEIVPSVQRWLIGAKAYEVLAQENLDYFSRSPRAALDQIQAEGQKIYRYQSATLTTENPKALWATISSLIDSYRRSLKKVENAARATRYESLKRLNTKLSDSGLCAINQIDDDLLFSYRARAIRHIGPTDEGFVKPLDIDYKIPGYFFPGSLFTGNINWPPVGNPVPAWNVVAAVPYMLDWDALGLGEVSIGYQAVWNNPTMASSEFIGGQFFYGNPSITYNIFATVPTQGKKLVGTFTESVGIEGIAYTNMTAPSVTQLRLNKATDLAGFIGNKEYGATGRAAVEVKFADVMAPQLTKRAIVVASVIKDDLLKASMNGASDLGMALTELEGSVMALRGFIGLAFPNYLREREELREILYGHPTAIRLDNLPPLRSLMTRDVAASLVSSVDGIMQDVAALPVDKQLPRLCELGTKTDLYILRNIAQLGEKPLLSLVQELKSAYTNASMQPDALVAIDEELGNFQLLHHIYSESKHMGE